MPVGSNLTKTKEFTQHSPTRRSLVTSPIPSPRPKKSRKKRADPAKLVIQKQSQPSRPLYDALSSCEPSVPKPMKQLVLTIKRAFCHVKPIDNLSDHQEKHSFLVSYKKKLLCDLQNLKYLSLPHLWF